MNYRFASWWKYVCDRGVVRRAVKVAFVVGTVLAVINYGDRFLSDSLSSRDLLKIAITYLVPYCVATYSAASVLASARTNQ
ncbi:MAG: hypothetical protein EXR86_02080 [Gammaproteobacteria bacterium]|nr:hypothetical protein [Gammaproteobacteria bacterium]